METSTAAAGDVPLDAALEVLIDQVMQPVYKYARFRLLNVQDAEDATMETLHALRKRPESFVQAENPLHYALGVCRRKVADIARFKRVRFWARPDQTPWPDNSDLQFVVHGALAQLSSDYREVLALKYFHQLTLEEIASVVGKSPAAVNSLLQRARKAFQAQLPEGAL